MPLGLKRLFKSTLAIALLSIILTGLSPASAADIQAETPQLKSISDYHILDNLGNIVTTSLKDNLTYYEVKNSAASVRFYDYYTVVYDDDGHIAVYDDRWDVEYLNKQGKWVSSSFYNVTRSYDIISADELKVYRTGDSDIGRRVEIYTFRAGEPCKIEIQQTCTAAQTIRYVWNLSGIVADSNTAVTNASLSNIGVLYTKDDKLVLVVDWAAELSKTAVSSVTEPYVIGKKTATTFGTFSATAGQTIVLDPTYRSVGQSPGANSTSCVVVKPVGLEVGDLMVAHIVGVDYGAAMNVATLSGWALIGEVDGDNEDGDCNYSVSSLQWKIAEAADVAAANFTFTITSSDSNRGTITAWTGHDPTTPINASSGQDNNASATVTAPTITPIADCTILLFCSVVDYNTHSGYAIATDNPASWTEAYDLPSDLTRDLGLAMGYADRPETSATGNGTATSSGAGHNIGQLIAIAPSAGATAPTVTNSTGASSIEDTTATINGNLTDNGGADTTVTIYWGNDDAGTTVVNWDYSIDKGVLGEGAFSSNLTELDTGTTYYYRCYAVNSEGSDWADSTESFLTKPAAPTNVAATDGVHTDKVVITWTKSDGATGYKVYEGENLLDTLGDVATYDDVAAPAPTITAGSAVASDGTFSAYVALSLSGTSVNNGASRTYKVVALNGTGDSDASSTDTGYRGHGALTYQWQRSAADSDADYSNIDGATTAAYNDTGAPEDGSGRYYKCVLNATGCVEQTSAVNRGYRAIPSVPTVTTDAFLGFGGTWAVLKGTITDDGDGAITEVGFDYGLTGAYGSDVTVTGVWLEGDSFVATITGLTRATVYHYRAKAYTTEGWGYGGDAYVSTEGSPAIYEYLNTGGDDDSAHIYANNWGAQSFTVGTASHTVSFARVYIKRTGSPGTVTISITHATAAGLPTGADIVSTTLDGDALSTSYTWYVAEFTETILDASGKYAIVIRAVAGDTDNDIQWRADAGGGLADAIACTSTDGGISWASASPIDYLFEIWGNPALDLVSASVFKGYLEDGDMLFLIHYKNIYAPYYRTFDSSQYFNLQLLDTDGVTLLAQIPCLQWGYMPGSIYLNADAAAGLTEGAAYYLRLYGTFTGNPSDSYQLTASDWIGENDSSLDQWVINTAYAIEDWYTDWLGTTVTLVTSSTSGANVLNDDGATIFIIGIPYLDVVRPDLFETAVSDISHTDIFPENTFEDYVTWQAMVGSQLENVAEDASDIFGMDADTVLGVGILFCYVGVAVFTFASGHTTAGLALSFPFIILAGALRVVDIGIIAIIGITAVISIVWSLWWKSG